MIYLAKRQNGKALFLMLLLSAGILLCAAFSLMGLPFRPLWQGGMMLFLVLLIQLGQRYLFCRYEYILDPEEELLLHNRLTVVQVLRGRRRILYTVPLTTLTDVIPCGKRKTVVAKYGTVKAWVNLCADLRPKISYRLLWEDNDALVAVRLQCDEAFAEKLRERAGL